MRLRKDRAITSLPGSGRWGTCSESSKDTSAIAAPAKKTAAGETNHKIPISTGSNTAAIWLMVNETPAVDAISAGWAIFWK